MVSLKGKFNIIMSIVWTIVGIVAGMYAVMEGGAMSADGSFADPNIQYIVASFGIPGFLSIIFAFCKSAEDIAKIKGSIDLDKKE